MSAAEFEGFSSVLGAPPAAGAAAAGAGAGAFTPVDSGGGSLTAIESATAADAWADSKAAGIAGAGYPVGYCICGG